MTNKWKEKRLEIITLGVFFILLLTSLLFLYNAYSNYALLVSSEYPERAFVHQIIMFISGTVLFLSLLIVYSKRDYFFVEKTSDMNALENLFEEIKLSSDELKIEQFKQMLKEQNHTEIYALISKMILELEESKKSINEANEIKTLFLSNMSHEIRTPITGIVGFTNFLTSSKLDKEQREFVNIIRKSSEELLGVVNNILDVSNLESGRFELNRSSFNIVKEFENFIDTYALDALEKEIEFSVWIDPKLSLLSIHCDIEKIKQVLINLISNAIKFSNNGAKVELSLKETKSSDSKVTIEFMVKDTGIGIDEEQRKQVFRLFNQVDNSNTRGYQGIGLGLTIANNLVKMLGGTLMLQSELEEGSTFSFSLCMSQSQNTLTIEDKNIDNQALNIAVYAPLEVQESTSNKHLLAYLSSFEHVSVVYFNTFVECKDANLDAFDVLYIHYDEIDTEELKRVVAQYSAEKPIVLVTKLSNRDNFLDIAPVFSQILYEPMTLPKIENSLDVITNHKDLRPLKIDENTFSLKALIVEDNVVNQKVIVHTLKSMGVESDIADNGEIGVEMFKKNQYDIVFMDIQMPVMNGVIATKHIVEYEEKYNLDHTPIVAVTTNALKGDRELYLSSGMDEYISKPISMSKFLTVIKQFYAPVEKAEMENHFEKKDILLYKKNPTEGKILTKLLSDVDYSVGLAKSREEFYYLMQKNEYNIFLIDKRAVKKEDEILMNKIREHKVPTLFFMDEKSVLTVDDMNIHTKIMFKTSDFSDVQEQVEKMMEL